MPNRKTETQKAKSLGCAAKTQEADGVECAAKTQESNGVGCVSKTKNPKSNSQKTLNFSKETGS